jgi:flavorubredoxin
MDVEMIVPQHGPAFRGKAMVNRFLDWISGLSCGIDLLSRNDYRAGESPVIEVDALATS